MELEVGVSITRDAGDLTFASTETDAFFILAAHLPGFTKEEIELGINEREKQINIRGGGNIVCQEAVIAGRVAVTREIAVECFDESFPVPDGVDWGGIDAWFDDEEKILVISIPKLSTGEHIMQVATERWDREEDNETDREDITPRGEERPMESEVKMAAMGDDFTASEEVRAAPEEFKKPEEGTEVETPEIVEYRRTEAPKKELHPEHKIPKRTEALDVTESEIREPLKAKGTDRKFHRQGEEDEQKQKKPQVVDGHDQVRETEQLIESKKEYEDIQIEEHRDIKREKPELKIDDEVLEAELIESEKLEIELPPNETAYEKPIDAEWAAIRKPEKELQGTKEDEEPKLTGVGIEKRASIETKEEIQKQEQEHEKPAIVQKYEKSKDVGLPEKELKERFHGFKEEDDRQLKGPDIEAFRARESLKKKELPLDLHKQNIEKPTLKEPKEMQAAEPTETEKEENAVPKVQQPEKQEAQEPKKPIGLSYEKTSTKFQVPKESGQKLEQARIDDTQSEPDEETKQCEHKMREHKEPTALPTYEMDKVVEFPQKEEPKPQVHELYEDEDRQRLDGDKEEVMKQKAKKQLFEVAESTKSREKEAKIEVAQPEEQEAQEYRKPIIQPTRDQVSAEEFSEPEKPVLVHDAQEHIEFIGVPKYEKPEDAGLIRKEEPKPALHALKEDEEKQWKILAEPKEADQKHKPKLKELVQMLEAAQIQSEELEEGLKQHEKEVQEHAKSIIVPTCEKPQVTTPDQVLEEEEFQLGFEKEFQQHEVELQKQEKPTIEPKPWISELQEDKKHQEKGPDIEKFPTKKSLKLEEESQLLQQEQEMMKQKAEKPTKRAPKRLVEAIEPTQPEGKKEAGNEVDQPKEQELPRDKMRRMTPEEEEETKQEFHNHDIIAESQEPKKQEEQLTEESITSEKEHKPMLEQIDSKEHQKPTVEAPYQTPEMIGFKTPEELALPTPKAPKAQYFSKKEGSEDVHQEEETMKKRHEKPAEKPSQLIKEEEKQQKSEEKPEKGMHQSKEEWSQECMNLTKELPREKHSTENLPEPKEFNQKERNFRFEAPDQVPEAKHPTKSKETEEEKQKQEQEEQHKKLETMQIYEKSKDAMLPELKSWLHEFKEDDDSQLKDSIIKAAGTRESLKPKELSHLQKLETKKQKLEVPKVMLEAAEPIKTDKEEKEVEPKLHQPREPEKHEEKMLIDALPHETARKEKILTVKTLEIKGMPESQESYKKSEESLYVEAELQLEPRKEIEAHEEACPAVGAQLADMTTVGPSERESQTEEVDQATESSIPRIQPPESEQQKELEGPRHQLFIEEESKEQLEQQFIQPDVEAQKRESPPIQELARNGAIQEPPDRAARTKTLVEEIMEQDLYRFEEGELEQDVESPKLQKSPSFPSKLEDGKVPEHDESAVEQPKPLSRRRGVMEAERSSVLTDMPKEATETTITLPRLREAIEPEGSPLLASSNEQAEEREFPALIQKELHPYSELQKPKEPKTASRQMPEFEESPAEQEGKPKERAHNGAILEPPDRAARTKTLVETVMELELYPSEEEELEHDIELPKLQKSPSFLSKLEDRKVPEHDETIVKPPKPLPRIRGVMEAERSPLLTTTPKEATEPTITPPTIRETLESEGLPLLASSNEEVIEREFPAFLQKELHPYSDLQKSKEHKTAPRQMPEFEESPAEQEGKPKEPPTPHRAQKDIEKPTEEVPHKILEVPQPMKICEVELKLYTPKELEEGQEESTTSPLDHDTKTIKEISGDDAEASGAEINISTKVKKLSKRCRFDCRCPAFPIPPSTLFSGSAFVFSIMVLVFHFVKRKKPDYYK